MEENGIKPQGKRNQDPDFAPDGSGGATSLKRKAAIVAAAALVMTGLGLGGARVTDAFAPEPEVAKSNGTLTGDAGKDVVNKVTDNASKAPAADKEKVEEKDAAADSAAKAEDNKSDAAKPSAGSSSSPSGSGSKPSSGSTSKPSHEHTWQAQYRTEPVYETRTRTVIDQPA